MTWLGARGFAMAAAAAWLASASPADAAYRDVRITGHAMRVELDEAGQAGIEHAVAYRVVAGVFTGMELPGVEADARIESAATVTTEDGRTIEAYAARKEPSSGSGPSVVHVDFLEPKGLRRGSYTVKLRYTTDFASSGALVREGAMWRLAWTSPTMPEGIDSMRVVFELPSAPTEPSAGHGVEATEGDEGVAGEPSSAAGSELLSTLRRTPERDALELVRLHVPRGEAVTWTARVDPKAFPALRAAEVRPPPPAVAKVHAIDRVGWLLAPLVAAAFFALVFEKGRRVRALADRARMEARALVPIALPARAASAAAAIGGGVALQSVGATNLGTLLVGVAMLCAVHRPAAAKAAPRGPGSWTMLRESEAFAVARRPGDPLDASTRRGKWVVLLAAALTAAAAVAAYGTYGSRAAALIVLDALALVPIFFTGTQADAPIDLAAAPVRFLRPLFAVLKKHVAALRVVPWARVPQGTDVHDELRLLVLPRASMPGLLGIEVGVAWPRDAVRTASSPEVLVRVQDASAAAARLVTLAPKARSCPGRKLNERVVRLLPELPTRSAMRALVVNLSDAFVDRRARAAEPTGWEGTERRLPPEARIAELRASLA